MAQLQPGRNADELLVLIILLWFRSVQNAWIPEERRAIEK
jgi:hypothetical protein